MGFSRFLRVWFSSDVYDGLEFGFLGNVCSSFEGRNLWREMWERMSLGGTKMDYKLGRYHEHHMISFFSIVRAQI